MRFAYADPPYIGQAAKHYANHPDYAGEVDHVALFAQIEAEYPDGWALSASEPSIPALCAMLETMGLHREEGAYRIAPWVKPFASFKPNVNPAFTWEPVFFRGGRKRDRNARTIKDHHIANITMRRGLAGAKPESFCWWVFDLLGAEPGDTLCDLFPGTGAVTRAWEHYLKREAPTQSDLLREGPLCPLPNLRKIG